MYKRQSGDSSTSSIDPMLRVPCPETGGKLCRSFSKELDDAVLLNNSVHDGALVFQKDVNTREYNLKYWSCRLFPPKADVAPLSTVL